MPREKARRWAAIDAFLGATSSMFLQSWRRMAFTPRSVSVSLTALICEMIVLAIVAMLNMKSLFMLPSGGLRFDPTLEGVAEVGSRE